MLYSCSDSNELLLHFIINIIIALCRNEELNGYMIKQNNNLYF